MRLKIPLLFLLAGFVAACHPARKLVKPELVHVPGGRYYQGDFVEGTDTDATPPMLRRVKPFRMMKFEVSERQYDTLARRFGWEIPFDSIAAENAAAAGMTWDEARRFCACLGMRLPTETEWEYAARSGGKKEAIAGAGKSDPIRLYASFERDPLLTRNRIGKKRPNGLGLHDMSGGVNEWVGSFIPVYKKPDRKINLRKNPMRIIRGGSFLQPLPAYNPDGFNVSTGMFTFRRIGVLTDSRNTDTGFRCVKDYVFPFLH